MTRRVKMLTQAHKERSVSEEVAFRKGAEWADEHPNWSSMPTKFKAKCVKADPLKTLEVGETYDCISWNGKVIEWLDEHVPTKFEDMQNYVNQFKEDFGL